MSNTRSFKKPCCKSAQMYFKKFRKKCNKYHKNLPNVQKKCILIYVNWLYKYRLLKKCRISTIQTATIESVLIELVFVTYTNINTLTWRYVIRTLNCQRYHGMDTNFILLSFS